MFLNPLACTNIRASRIVYPGSNIMVRPFCSRRGSVVLLWAACLPHSAVVHAALVHVTAEWAHRKLSDVPKTTWRFSGIIFSWCETNKNILPDWTQLRLQSNVGTYLLIHVGGFRQNPTPIETLRLQESILPSLICSSAPDATDVPDKTLPRVTNEAWG